MNLSHGSFNPTTSTLLTNLPLLYVNYCRTLRTKTNRAKDREEVIRSNATSARPFITELLYGRRPQSEAPWVSKFGNLSIREILVLKLAYARLPARTDSGGGGREFQGNPTGGRRIPSFLGGKSRGTFGQPAFFLAENPMTIVAFEKEVSLRSFSCIALRILNAHDLLRH